MKWTIPLALMLLLAGLVTGVNNNTNLTLRSACVEASGALCTDTAKWTVILPNGSTLYNETTGGATAYGVQNFTIWFNETGTWFVLANHSVHNFSSEFNVVVEDYKTDTIGSVWEEVAMSGSLILFGMMILGLLYAGFSLKDEHAVLKLILVAVGIILVPVAFIVSQYSMIAGTAASGAMQGVVVISAVLLGIIGVYVFLYFFIKVIQVMMGYGKKMTGGKKR